MTTALSSAPAEAKSALRAAAKRRRAGAPAVDVTATLRTPLAGGRFSVIAGYVALPGECDPGPALHALHADGATIALPRTIAGAPLDFRRWSPGDALEDGPFGTRQPATDAPVAYPNAVIVPLLAFDRRGGRLGYGGGYYDRSLAALRAAGPLFVLGLAAAAQEVDAVPMEPWDQRLDAIATERELIVTETK